jgi:hypothetical protein
MAKWLKKSVGGEAVKTADRQVHETVENILADIEACTLLCASWR